jgi:hypothetical protein
VSQQALDNAPRIVSGVPKVEDVLEVAEKRIADLRASLQAAYSKKTQERILEEIEELEMEAHYLRRGFPPGLGQEWDRR